MRKNGFIVIVWCIIIAEICVYKGDSNMLAITVALIGLIGSIWIQIIQFKKDSNRIDGVGNTTNDIHKDTIEIKPKISNIENNSNMIKDDILRYVLPRLDNISNINSCVQELLTEKKTNDAMRNVVSSSIDDPDYIKNALDLVYYRNAQLETENKELNQKIYAQNQIINKLEKENMDLKAKNTVLRNELQDIEIER